MINDMTVSVTVIGSFEASMDRTLTPYEYEIPISPKKKDASHEK